MALRSKTAKKAKAPTTLKALRKELAKRGYGLTEVRILDLLIWSVAAAPS